MDNRVVAARLLAVAAPTRLPTARPSPYPQTLRLGVRPHAQSEKFSIDKSWKFSVAIDKGGYHTWSDQEIETYRATHETGSKARLALELLLSTGASRVDANNFTRANIAGPRLRYRRQKTEQEVDLPILPELGRELSYLRPTQMVLLSREDGSKGYANESFGNLFRRWCAEAGLPHCAAHGLRKAGARRLAEAGATEFEVMSFLGHGTAREASRYVAAANRATLADSGMAKLGAKTRTKLSNLSERLDKLVS